MISPFKPLLTPDPARRVCMTIERNGALYVVSGWGAGTPYSFATEDPHRVAIELARNVPAVAAVFMPAEEEAEHVEA